MCFQVILQAIRWWAKVPAFSGKATCVPVNLWVYLHPREDVLPKCLRVITPPHRSREASNFNLAWVEINQQI